MCVVFFFLNNPATTEISPLPLHAPLPIAAPRSGPPAPPRSRGAPRAGPGPAPPRPSRRPPRGADPANRADRTAARPGGAALSRSGRRRLSPPGVAGTGRERGRSPLRTRPSPGASGLALPAVRRVDGSALLHRGRTRLGGHGPLALLDRAGAAASRRARGRDSPVAAAVLDGSSSLRDLCADGSEHHHSRSLGRLRTSLPLRGVAR